MSGSGKSATSPFAKGEWIGDDVIIHMRQPEMAYSTDRYGLKPYNVLKFKEILSLE